MKDLLSGTWRVLTLLGVCAALFTGGLVLATHTHAAAGQTNVPASPALGTSNLDDYPWKGLTFASGGDGWGMAYGQCVSYVAWKIYEDDGGTQHPPTVPDAGWMPNDANRIPINFNWGNAGDWANSARNAGLAVDHTPEVGDIAQWNNGSDNGQFTVGHVAFVYQVNSDGSVELAQYNLREDSQFSTLHLPTSGAWDTSNGHSAFFVTYPDNFIHFGDAAGHHQDAAGHVGYLEDGREQLFSLGADGTLWTIFKQTTSPGSAWSSWSSLGHPAGVTLSARFAVGYLSDGRLSLVAVGTDGNLWNLWKQTTSPGAGWSSWLSLGHPAGVSLGQPNAGYLSDGRPNLFAVGSDGNLWNLWKTSTDPNSPWSSWSSLGAPSGVAFGALTVGYLSDSRPTLFAVGSDGNLWNLWKTSLNSGSAWSAWASLGHPANGATGEPKVNYLSDGRLNVFVVGTDGNLWNLWKTSTDPNASWSAWSSLGAPTSTTVGPLALATNADGRPQVFSVGLDGNLWTRWKLTADPNAAWSSWSNVGRGSAPLTDPFVGANTAGVLEVFAAGTDQHMWHIWQQSGSPPWSSWTDMGGNYLA